MRAIKIGAMDITERATQSFKIYLKELRKYEPLSADKEISLFEQMKAGSSKAREKLIKHNLRFVVSVAKKYYNITRHEKYCDLSDLVCIGNVGLVNAIDRHDITRGFKLLTFAVKYIQGEIMNFLNDNGFVRIPRNRIYELNKIRNYVIVQSSHGNRQITFDEAIYEMDWARGEDLMKANNFLTYNNIIKLDDQIPDTESQYDNNFCWSDDEQIENRYVDRIADSGEKSQPDYQLIIESNTINIYRALSTCTIRETEVVGLFFGIGIEGSELTLEEIGNKFGLTRERVRQIKAKTIRRLGYKTRSDVILFGGFQKFPFNPKEEGRKKYSRKKKEHITEAESLATPVTE
jgi:RNA polymerase primary sigma factor